MPSKRWEPSGARQREAFDEGNVLRWQTSRKRVTLFYSFATGVLPCCVDFMPATFAPENVIVRDPSVCGQPVVKGTRVTLRTVLATLAEGASVEEVVKDFPSLQPSDVRAVIAYAAASAEEDLPVAGVPAGL